MIFDLNENTITAHGIIWEGDGMEFLRMLESAEKAYSSLTIRMHTYGGSVFDGNLMYNAIKDSPADIRIEIIGVAASMGAIIALSAKEVYMAENGFLMLHAPSGSSNGTVEDHLQTVKLLKSIEASFIARLREKTGQSMSYVKKWIQGDNWFDAGEALAEKLITGITDQEVEIAPIDPTNMSAREVYNRFAAVLLPKPKNESKSKTTMKTEIIDALNLTGVNAQSSDTAVINAVKQHFENQLNTLNQQLTAQKNKVKEFEEAAKAAREKEIDTFLKAALKQGKITAEKEDTYRKIAQTSGLDALIEIVGEMNPRQPVSGRIHGKNGLPNGIPANRADWDWDQWQKEDPRGLENLSKDNPEAYEELFNQKYQKQA